MMTKIGLKVYQVVDTQTWVNKIAVIREIFHITCRVINVENVIRILIDMVIGSRTEEVKIPLNRETVVVNGGVLFFHISVNDLHEGKKVLYEGMTDNIFLSVVLNGISKGICDTIGTVFLRARKIQVSKHVIYFSVLRLVNTSVANVIMKLLINVIDCFLYTDYITVCRESINNVIDTTRCGMKKVRPQGRNDGLNRKGDI